VNAEHIMWGLIALAAAIAIGVRAGVALARARARGKAPWPAARLGLFQRVKPADDLSRDEWWLR